MPPPPDTPGPPPPFLARWVPGLATLRAYRRAWFYKDLVAGLVLTAILVPVGMGYAQASGLPAIYGLYASIVPLIAYAVFGPSRIMVLGPDSTLAAVIAALILPLSAGSVERAVALAGALAMLSGAFSLLMGVARLGLVADLLSKPIRLGFMNAIAFTVIIGQLPKVLGFAVQADGLPAKVGLLWQGVAQGSTNLTAVLMGAGSFALIVWLKRFRQRWPGVLISVVLGTLVSAWLDLHGSAQLAVLGELPQGLPSFQMPQVSMHDLVQLLPGAAIIAMLTFADTTVLSRSLAQRGGYRVSQNQEMVALGAANIATGLFQGFAVSGSSSRTPVAEAAGAQTQVAGLVGALAIALLLYFAPALLQSLPSAVLGAVVISACLSFADLRGMWALLRLRKIEFLLSVVSFLGVAFIGVIEGIFIAVALAIWVLVWNAWHPYFAVLARVDGTKGYHDMNRHPEARRVPGLMLFRWDAPLFFANAEVFSEQLLLAVAQADTPTQRVVVASEAITDVDITAADMLVRLHQALALQGISLWFAGLKGPVKDRLKHYGTLEHLGTGIFSPTVGSAVHAYRDTHPVDWKDWDEV